MSAVSKETGTASNRPYLFFYLYPICGSRRSLMSVSVTGQRSKTNEAMAPQLNVVVQGKKVVCPGAHLLLDVVPGIQKGGVEIRLPDERHVEALKTVVGYLSGDGVDGIGVHNAAEILDCTKLLGLDDVRDACEDLLVERVTADNCLFLREMASTRGLLQLKGSCDRFLSESFASALLSLPVLELPRVHVHLDVSSQLMELEENLLDKAAPNVLSVLDSLRRRSRGQRLEEAVVQLILRPDYRVSEWSRENRDRLFHAPLSPERNTAEFYAKLRGVGGGGCSPARQLILSSPKKVPISAANSGGGLRLITTARLTDSSAACLVEDNKEGNLLLVCISLSTILQNGQLPASPTTGLPAFSQTSGCFISPLGLARSGCSAVATESDILAIGGFNRTGCLDSTESFSSITNSWKVVEKMLGARGRLSSVLLEDKVYAIGGSDGRSELSSVEVLDLKGVRQWRKMTTSMPTPRSCLAAAVLGDVVYVVGGEHYSVTLKTTELFDPFSESWRTLSPLSTARSDLALAAVDGKLYAIGGKAPGLKCLSTVEVYHPTKNIWSRVTSMKTPRRNAAAVVVGEKIMVIGGYSGSEVLRSVELYDPENDVWSECTPLCSARSHAAVVLYNLQIYVIGGYSGSLFLNTVECYDPRTEQWTLFA